MVDAEEAFNEKELENHIIDIWKHLPDNKVLLDNYLENAIEAEADGP
jgi:carbamoyl-phosphate synthase large subunit